MTLNGFARGSESLSIDSIPRTLTEQLRWTSYIAPATMIGVCAFGISNGWMSKLNKEIGKEIGGCSPLRIDDYLQFLPAAAAILPTSCYPHSRYSWKDRVCLTVTAAIIDEALVQIVKRTVKSPRPDGSDNHSFPSGHSARAFLGAEILRISCGTWPAVAGYAVAASVGVMRIMADRHSFTDVIGGAGFGLLSANLAQLLLPIERRLFRWDKTSAMVVAIPMYESACRTPTLSLAIYF